VFPCIYFTLFYLAPGSEHGSELKKAHFSSRKKGSLRPLRTAVSQWSAVKTLFAGYSAPQAERFVHTEQCNDPKLYVNAKHVGASPIDSTSPVRSAANIECSPPNWELNSGVLSLLALAEFTALRLWNIFWSFALRLLLKPEIECCKLFTKWLRLPAFREKIRLHSYFGNSARLRQESTPALRLISTTVSRDRLCLLSLCFYSKTNVAHRHTCVCSRLCRSQSFGRTRRDRDKLPGRVQRIVRHRRLLRHGEGDDDGGPGPRRRRRPVPAGANLSGPRKLVRRERSLCFTFGRTAGSGWAGAAHGTPCFEGPVRQPREHSEGGFKEIGRRGQENARWKRREWKGLRAGGDSVCQRKCALAWIGRGGCGTVQRRCALGREDQGGPSQERCRLTVATWLVIRSIVAAWLVDQINPHSVIDWSRSAAALAVLI